MLRESILILLILLILRQEFVENLRPLQRRKVGAHQLWKGVGLSTKTAENLSTCQMILS